MTRATVNGSPHQLPTAVTLADVVRDLTDRTTGVAVALNGEVVPRHAWPTTSLVDGDVVEVLTAAQGG